MGKVDATNGLISGADSDGRWDVLSERLERVRMAAAEPIAETAIAGCKLSFWSEDAELTVSAERDGRLVGYLCVARNEGVLLGVDVAVRKACRRTGIASAMYDFAEFVMQARFIPCQPHSPHAQAFWSNR